MVKVIQVGAVLALMCLVKLRAQDVTPALLYANPLIVNPAMAGLIEGKLGFDFSHRIRVGTEDETFNTSVFTGDYVLDTRKVDGGLGLMLSTDQAGGIRTNQFQAAFAYEAPLGLKVRYHHLRAGFQLGVIQRSIDEPSLIFEDQFDAATGTFINATGETQVVEGLSSPVALDASVGVLFYNTQKIKGNPELNYFVGAAVQHLSRPDLSFFPSDGESRTPIRFTAHGGVKYRTRSLIDLNAHAIILSQNNSQLLQWGVFMRAILYEGGKLFGNEQASIYLGLNAQQQLNSVEIFGSTVRRSGLESVAPYFAFEYNRSVGVSFAYQVALSEDNLVPTTYGGLQISASYRLGGNTYAKNSLPFPAF